MTRPYASCAATLLESLYITSAAQKNALLYASSATAFRKAVGVTFGNWLRMHREAANLTLRELAEKSGLHYTAIHRIEMGYRKAKPETVERLAAALGADPETGLAVAGTIPIDELPIHAVITALKMHRLDETDQAKVLAYVEELLKSSK